MATNANLALAEVRTQNFLDPAIALRSHSYFAWPSIKVWPSSVLRRRADGWRDRVSKASL
jgi:hypothetical protein